MKTISEEYLRELDRLHNDRSRPRGFGGKVKNLGTFWEYVAEYKPTSILDYGCGKGVVTQSIIEETVNLSRTSGRYTSNHKVQIVHGYDPAVPDKNTIPLSEYDCVFSIDVLEHIEPDLIDNVLQHFNQLSKTFIWSRIDTLPALKKLSDGRNAHLILENQDWWNNKFSQNIDGEIVYSNLGKKGKLDICVKKT